MKAVVTNAARLAAVVGVIWGLGALSSSRVQAGPVEEISDVEKQDLADLARKDPATFTLCEQADAAFRAGDLAQAAALYQRGRVVAPKNVVPARGACRVALLQPGEETGARLACQRAFMLSGTPEDMR